MTSDLNDAVYRHAELFNQAVRTGDFTEFVATFDEDAEMRFTNVPVGPFQGRSAIAAAYRAQPPVQTLSIRMVEAVDPVTARVKIDYDGGGSGEMVVGWRDGKVSDLEISFD